MAGVTVYISIGNSDDKLTQAEWSAFALDLAAEVASVGHLHGSWASQPLSPWQNACWCVEYPGEKEAAAARATAAVIGRKYQQESISWAVALRTDFL
jgi:hypothetical protein